MRFSYEDQDNISVLTIRGDLTADHCGLLIKMVRDRQEAGVRDFVVDMADVGFVDSEGLKTLLWLQDTCVEQLGQVRLAGPTDNVQTILMITRLRSRLDSHPDVQAAIRSLREGVFP